MKVPQRILFLADINSTHTERWVISLLEKGFLIALFSLSDEKKTWTKGLSNFEYECFGISDNQTKSNSRFGKVSYFSARRKVKEYYQSFKPDIVHAHYASSYGTLARGIGHERTVLSLWGSDVYQFPKRSPIHRFLFKRAVKFAKVVCSTSSDMAREASIYVKRDYVITPFGVDTNRFALADIRTTSEMITIGTAKMLEDVYGIDRLLKMYSVFRQKVDSPSRLLIYGEGGRGDFLKELTKELKIEEHVSFMGFVTGEDLVKAYQSFDVFVSLSRRESFGVATLEAQSCGALAMVTNVGGLPEVTCPESGRIVNEDDEENWVNDLIELSQEARIVQQKEQARTFVEQNFSDKACVDKLIEVYQNV
jgi:glycosyltransferase involved in cell wall biosynthesis